jgi:O-succinylbenzoate synthase
MKIEQINIYQVALKFKKPFSASWGSFQERFPTIIEITSEGLSAWGEAAALPFPYYSHEDSESVYRILLEYLCPAVLKEQPQTIDQLQSILSRIKLNNIAKSGVEMAFWDLLSKREAKPLYQMLGSTNTIVQCGATLSSDLGLEHTINRVSELVGQGYRKIRLKISRSSSLQDLEKIFCAAPAMTIALDANGCFTFTDLPFLQKLDQLGAIYFEQPFPADDLLSHAQLQAQIKTPICLDECIFSLNQAKIALHLKSSKAFSLKSARLGGHAELLEVYKLCQTNNIKLVAGGMFESGIGRAHALAVASLSGFSFPAALSESKYYYEEDIVHPEFSFSEPGLIKLADTIGVGVEPDLKLIQQLSRKSEIIRF